MLLNPKKRAHRTKAAESAAAESKAIAEEITKELYRKNLELAHTNRTLTLLRSIDELVLQAETTIEQLSTGVAQAIVSSSTYSMCGVFINKNDDDFYLKGYSFVDLQMPERIAAHLVQLRLETPDSWFANGQKSEVLSLESTDKISLAQAFGSNSHLVHEVAALSGTRSLVLIKLMARQRIAGILLVGMLEDVGHISTDERLLLERLSEAIGVAIDNKLLFEENKAVLKKLKVSNQKLVALDEAKDEFISMASHQLRTPLTSVKGYLSMLQEGDAGKLNESQSKFVNQAFVSSQRMVYLIADLLNVSRLKTGKFIIEAAAVFLPDVVESEIAQLYETVKARGLTMKFNKPKKFPILHLDETKIRQVIMNFADNAIYYTPTGGKISIELKEVNGGVEFTVTDNGLGVPKADQPHLFTKFYRAGNARKARPDGTGLGLFMAKKVVVAQDGSLIFKTAEGKGSTFGFRFNLPKKPPTK